MEYGGLGDPGPPVIPRLGKRKEQGSVTVQHLFMVGSSAAMDLQLRKFLAQALTLDQHVAHTLWIIP